MTTDPFADSLAIPDSERAVVLESTLAVGRNASLTLGTDSLIVLDEGFRDNKSDFSCCGLLHQRSTATRSIPYFNILSAELSKVDLTITYVKSTSSRQKKHAPLYVTCLSYTLGSPDELAQTWLSRLMSRAYGSAQRNKRIKVLINPYGGAGKAAKMYNKYVAPIFQAAECSVDVERTAYRGHAGEIAEGLDVDAYDVLACASGDGLPMESFNGLARKPNATEALRRIAVVQLPCGTGNAMSLNLNGTNECSMAALCIIKGVRTPLDLASITQGSTRTLSFLSQSIGIVAETDLGTDNIRWMGDFRFTFGFLVRLLGKTQYPIDIAVKMEIDDKIGIKQHYAREMVERRKLDEGHYDILDEDLETQTGLGLPPLKYGTINDPLPNEPSSGWSALEPYYNLGNFYCGNMCWMAADTPFFPASLPNDGMLDLVTVDGDIGRMKALDLLLSVGSNKFFDQDIARVRKVTGVRVIPRFGWAGAQAVIDSSGRQAADLNGEKKHSLLGAKIFRKLSGRGKGKEGCFSVDGEKLPFEPFQIEIHRGLGTVLSRRMGMYEHEGPRDWEDWIPKDTRPPTAVSDAHE